MVQQVGETRDAIIESDSKLIEEIISSNKHRKDPYWIVLFAKPSKVCVDGKPTLIKHIKPYSVRPVSMVGAAIAEVNNQTGEIKWEVNLPQRPFDFAALQLFGAKPCDEVVVETTTIPWAYATQ